MDEKLNKKSNRILINIALLSIIVASGSQAFFRFHGTITQVGFLLFSILFHNHFPCHTNRRSLTFVCFYSFYVLVNSCFINGNGLGTIEILTYVIFAIGAYLIISKIPWNVFVDRLIIIVGYLAIVSIVVFIISELNILTPSIVEYKGVSYYLLFYHVIGWAEPFHRLAGIYWEPGAYQIVLNSTLLVAINFLKTKEKDERRKYYRYLSFIISASLLTLSTTGYVILFLLLSYIVYLKNRYTKLSYKSFISLIISLILLVITSYGVFMSEPIQKKINQFESGGTNSAMIRQADNLALIQMISEKPLFGYGLKTAEFSKRSEQLDNLTSSNGNLFFASIFGIPFYLLILFRCYQRSKEMGDPPIFNTILFVAINMGECFLYYPFIFIFLLYPSNQTE